MNARVTLSLAALVCLQAPLQALNLQGRITNASGRGIANAVVTLTPLGLSDTSGADGAYAITGPTSVSPISGRDLGITFRDGILEVPVTSALPLRIDVFDTRGTLLRSENLAAAPAGVHRWNITDASTASKVVLVRVAIGGEVVSFRHALMHDGSSSVASLGGGAMLARIAAVPDSLRVSAKGYFSKTVPVPSLESTLDVKLDTNTSSKNPPGGSAGCGKTPTLVNGARKIQSGSDNRDYTLRIPTGYDNRHPYPLVFAFHWNGGTMGDVDGGGTSGYTWSYYGLREKADKSTDNKMIFVTPQGIGGGWPNSGGRDLRLVDDMLKLLKNDLCVDTTRIFSMGFSYGGGMTNAIACARAKVFRGAAVYAGAQLSGCEDGTQPIAYIGLHGLRDPTCRIDGGRGLRDRFVKNNKCTAQNPPEPANGSLKHICTTYQGCMEGYPVRWCAFDGAGHSPAPVDGTTSDYGGGDKTWTKDEVWTFFTQF
jgi:poly(3-hydroxybutyrate) depolymerase